MKRPRLLWIQTADNCASVAPRAVAEDYFEIELCSGLALALAATERSLPQVVCCEFEHTHAAQLRAMRAFKLANPSLPLLMLTSQHSEALAVWAFRARVWNYLVKPVPTNELRSNFSILARLISGTAARSARSIEAVGALLPSEVFTTLEDGNGSLQSVPEYVERNYTQKLRQSDVAELCGMSIYAFSRAFKTKFGLTFSDYLMRYRIGRACRLLREGSHGATSAGLAVGFDDPSHFARAFRNLLGTSPSLYQRQRRPGFPETERRSANAVAVGSSTSAMRRLSDSLLPMSETPVE